LQLVDGSDIKVTKITNNHGVHDYKGTLKLLGGAKIEGSIGTLAGANGKTGLAEITLGDNTLQLVDGSDIKVTKITNNHGVHDYKGKLQLLGGAKIEGSIGTLAGNNGKTGVEEILLDNGAVDFGGDINTKRFHLGHGNSIANIGGNLNVTDGVTTAVGNHGILRISNNLVLTTNVGRVGMKLDAIEIAADHRLTVNSDVHLANGIKARVNNQGTVIMPGANVTPADIINSGAGGNKLKLFEASTANANIDLTENINVNTINLTNLNQTLNVNNTDFDGKITGTGRVRINGNSNLQWLGEVRNKLRELEITNAANNVILNKTLHTHSFILNGGSTTYNSKTLGVNNVILANNARIRFNGKISDATPLRIQGRGHVTLAGGGHIGAIGTQGVSVVRVEFVNNKTYGLDNNIYSDTLNFDNSTINPANDNIVIYGAYNKVPYGGWQRETATKIITARAAQAAADEKLKQEADRQERKRLKLAAEARAREAAEKAKAEQQLIAAERERLKKENKNKFAAAESLIQISNQQITNIKAEYNKNMDSTKNIEDPVKAKKERQKHTKQYVEETSKEILAQTDNKITKIKIEKKDYVLEQESQANKKFEPITKDLTDALNANKVSGQYQKVMSELLNQEKELAQKLAETQLNDNKTKEALAKVKEKRNELHKKAVVTEQEARVKIEKVTNDLTDKVQNVVNNVNSVEDIDKVKNEIFVNQEQFNALKKVVAKNIGAKYGTASDNIENLGFSDALTDKADKKDLKKIDAFMALQNSEQYNKMKKSDYDPTIGDPNIVNGMSNLNTSNITNRIGVGGGDETVRGVDNVWITGMYNTASQNKLSEKNSGYKGTTTGVTAGVDYRVTEDSLIGVSLGNMMSTIKTKNEMSETIKIENYTYSLYSSTDLTNKLHWDNIISFGQSDVKTNRSLTFEGLTAKGKGKYKNSSYNISTTLGYKVKAGKTGITILPSIGLNYGHQKNGTYKEKCLVINNRTIKANSSNSLFGTIGTKIMTTANVSDNLTITPDIHAAINTQLSSTKRRIQLKLGLDDQFKEVKIKNKDKTTYNLGTGATAKINNMVDLSAGYDVNMRKKYKSHQGTLKLKVYF
ncbi:MAG: autotransporter domain-containing protein, partial [Rickettsiaceae bacterium]|nr:autotransporter domain-containing protein [Rickettsiaceae bacterium]